MPRQTGPRPTYRLGHLRRLRRHAPLLLLPPALILADALGGEAALLVAAILCTIAAGVLLAPRPEAPERRLDPLTGLAQRGGVVRALDRAIVASSRLGRSTGAMMIEIDRFKSLEERHDRPTIERILCSIATRLAGAVRDSDLTARLDGPVFAVALSPARRLSLEPAIHLAGRIQRALSDPIQIGGASVHVTCSIGFALAARLDQPTGEQLLQAATAAMIDAQRNGPAAIRSYSDAMRSRITSRNGLAREVGGALDAGQVRPVFQPQVSGRTGAITGVEALARWYHPVRGMIPPLEFLPAMEESGLMGRLGEVMVASALEALRHWDAEGFDIPRVGVNFSSEELSDPRLVDRIARDLDTAGVAPDRLVVEVLETVVAGNEDDMVIRNISGLARLGCCLDLDDFGTGSASITSIRRFSIERIKIDRSFVTRIDEDPEQQKMVSAILTMADRLGIEALAEGVETEEEQEMLTRLGCAHLQGYAIARPMPLAETDAWIRARLGRNGAAIALPRRAIAPETPSGATARQFPARGGPAP